MHLIIKAQTTPYLIMTMQLRITILLLLWVAVLAFQNFQSSTLPHSSSHLPLVDPTIDEEQQLQSNFALSFKKKSQSSAVDHHSSHSQKKKEVGWFQRAKRFLPDLYQSWIRTKKRSALKPVSSSGSRYHVQLVLNRFDQSKHLIKTLTAVLPDMSEEFASEVVEIAGREGKAVIRVFESLVRNYSYYYNCALMIVSILRRRRGILGKL